MTEPPAVTWVVGAGGLLGTALSTAVRRTGTTAVLTQRISWTLPQARSDLSTGLDRLAAAVRQRRAPWRIAWCAGAGVTGAAQPDLDEEVATLADFLAQLAGRRPTLGPGTFFLASSAGGVYAGCPQPGPYTENHQPGPISGYGRAKLRCEQLTLEYAAATGDTVQIGRIANLYGPGQNLAKEQGLISHLCRGNLSRQPISIYVSLDTIRDYLFAADCGQMIADMLELGQPPSWQSGYPVTKVLASQQGTTIAGLIAVCRQVFKRAPRLVLGTSANARFQVRDLRLRSVIWPEIDRRALTTLPAGIAATSAGILRTRQLAAC